MSPRFSTRDLTQRTLKGAAWVGGASAVRLGLRVISVGVLARLLTPQEYGIVAGALVAMDLAAMIYTLGLAPTLIQRKEIMPAHVATALFSSLALAILAAAGMWVVAPWAASLMRIPELADVLRVFALLTPFGAFNTTAEALLARNMEVRSVALRPLLSVIVAAFAVAIPMAYAGFGYWSLVSMQAAEIVISVVVLGIAARRYLVRPALSGKAFRDLWPTSLWFSINQPFVFAATNADKFLIARLLGAEALGLYGRASFVTNTASNLFSNITRLTTFPAMALVQDDKARLGNALLVSLSLIAAITLPTIVFSIVFANEIIGILLGPQWGAAVLPFAILMPILYVRLGTRALFVLFQARGKLHLAVVTHALHASLLFLGVAIAAPHGLAAVCVAVLAVVGSVFIVLLIMVRKEIGVSMKSLAALHARPALFSSVLLITTAFVKSSGLSGYASLATSLVGVLALTLALLRIWPELVLPPIGIEFLRRLSGSLSARFRSYWGD